MNNVNRTLYIPLYGKAMVSKRGIILQDKKAEEIWKKEGVQLKGKAKSKWLTFLMSMRAMVFDDWVVKQMKECPDAVVLHIGCGLDSRILRVKNSAKMWYDIDFPEVMKERRLYYAETEQYQMISGNAIEPEWLNVLVDSDNAIVLLEGISMYLMNEEVTNLFEALQKKYNNLKILMDVYTVFGAKASKYKNPINDVGVTEVYGMDDPEIVLRKTKHKLERCEEKNDFTEKDSESLNIFYVKEHTMTPDFLVNELKGFEKFFFKNMFAGSVAHKTYRLHEYETK